jgi:hypothetical protein
MTLQEFKAWFEGFTEGMPGAPNKDQWKRIKARVKEIDGVAVTYPVFIDRYVHHYPHYVWPTFTNGAGTIATNNGIGTITMLNDGHSVFDSVAAMCDLGEADYHSLS